MLLWILAGEDIAIRPFVTDLQSGCSADTWLVESGFLCVDSASNAVTEEECNFGPTFDTNASSTFVDFPDHNFNISYGDGGCPTLIHHQSRLHIHPVQCL